MDRKNREKPARRSMKTGHLCIPRLKAAASATPGSSTKNRRFTPVTLLERFRVAVFRLIMISALSSSSSQAADGSVYNNPTSGQACQLSRSYNYDYYGSTHQSEALADCIEFIKKKACRQLEGGEEQELCRSSDGSTNDLDDSIVDAYGEIEVVMPMPVM